MGDGRLGGSQVDTTDGTAALRRFLLDLDGERKGQAVRSGAGHDQSKDHSRDSGKDNAYGNALKDGFLRFDDPFSLSNKTEKSKTASQVDQIHDLVGQRNIVEKALTTEQKDDLRRARRDYSLAKTADEKTAYAKQIEGLVPGSAALNGRIQLALFSMKTEIGDVSAYDRISPRYTSTIHCHSTRPEPSWAEQQAAARRRNEYQLREQVRDAADGFYKPRPEDQFEARWAQMALESPIVKGTEALKQLPPIKISAENTSDVVKFGLTVAGVDLDSQSREKLERVAGSIKSISKEGANRFVVERDMNSEILLPEKQQLKAGIAITGIEVGSIRFQLGDGKYPELKNIEGLKVKLEVPTLLNKVGQIDNEAQIKRIFMTRNEGSGDFTVHAEVVNPVPSAVRTALHLFNSEVPVNATIVAAIAVLGPDGKPR
ncbi:hypothetical protein KBI23_16045 [bacterium]|nr:hypothetical protein [bacterium]MBP9810910.1 hypothetical protein [bacterium]